MDNTELSAEQSFWLGVINKKEVVLVPKASTNLRRIYDSLAYLNLVEFTGEKNGLRRYKKIYVAT